MPVFISYSSKDQRTALTICKALESRGQRCWISCRDVAPGENFQESIVRALRGARVMLLVFSSNANNSEEIKKELVLAGRHHVTVIPVRVEDVVPNDAFAYEFATRQWIDLFQDWDREMETLVGQITQILQTAPGEKPAENRSAPPLSPERNSTRSLLIGAAVIVLLAAGGTLAYFKPWASPAAPLPPPVLATAPANSAPIAAATPSAPLATSQPTPVPAPASPPEKTSTAMPAPKPVPKPKSPVLEAVVVPESAATHPPSQAAPAPPPESAANSDDGAWTAASTANSRDGFAAYLKAYPSGAHAGEAQLQIANLILSGPATGANFDGRWHTVWTCPNIGSFLGYSYQFDGQVNRGVYHGVKGNKGEPSSMVLDGKIDSDGAAAFTGEVIVGSSATGLGASRGTVSDFHAAATFTGGGGTGHRLEGRGCSLSFSRS